MIKFPKRLSRKKIFSSKLLDLFLDKVKLSSGIIIEEYHYIEFKNDSVVVIMINEKDEICLIKSPRYVTQRVELELPAGSIEEGESIFEAAKREVLEETGYKIDALEHVYTFNPANAISDQKAYVLFGKINSIKPVRSFNTDEVSSVEWVKKENIRELILSNIVMDGFSLVGLLLFEYLKFD